MNKKAISQLAAIILAVVTLFLLFALLIPASQIIESGRDKSICDFSQYTLSIDTPIPFFDINHRFAEAPACTPKNILFKKDGIYVNNKKSKEYETSLKESVYKEIANALLDCDRKFTPNGAHRGGNTIAICGEIQFVDSILEESGKFIFADRVAEETIVYSSRENERFETAYGGQFGGTNYYRSGFGLHINSEGDTNVTYGLAPLDARFRLDDIDFTFGVVDVLYDINSREPDPVSFRVGFQPDGSAETNLLGKNLRVKILNNAGEEIVEKELRSDTRIEDGQGQYQKFFWNISDSREKDKLKSVFLNGLGKLFSVQIVHSADTEIKQFEGFHRFMNDTTIIESEQIKTKDGGRFVQRFPIKKDEIENYPDNINVSPGAKYYIYYKTDGKERTIGLTQDFEGIEGNIIF